MIDHVAVPAERLRAPVGEYSVPAAWARAKAELNRFARRHTMPWGGKLPAPASGAFKLLQVRKSA